jgi:hypothetical protein
LRWAKMAAWVPTGETFVGTELTGVRTGETFAVTNVIFARIAANCTGQFGTETIGRPAIFAAISGMTSEICTPIGATCVMTVVISDTTVVTFDATDEGKVPSEP